MSICCDNSSLIIKQREEIVALIKTTHNQEEQINLLHTSCLKQKEQLKSFEHKQTVYEKNIKTFNLEIFKLKEALKKNTEEIELLKQKLSQKDAYIQTQANKIITANAAAEKCNIQMNNLKKVNEETKLENSKFNKKLKEHLNQISELKEKLNQQNKILESKNNLIQTSADHINSLELNLNKLIEYIEPKKSLNDLKNSKDNTKLKITANDLIWKKVQSNDSFQLTEILQSLKETWLESNLKYEEIKNLIITKYKDETINEKCSSIQDIDDISILSRLATSSPNNN